MPANLLTYVVGSCSVERQRTGEAVAAGTPIKSRRREAPPLEKKNNRRAPGDMREAPPENGNS
jgi:hypothetical protein